MLVQSKVAAVCCRRSLNGCHGLSFLVLSAFGLSAGGRCPMLVGKWIGGVLMLCSNPAQQQTHLHTVSQQRTTVFKLSKGLGAFWVGAANMRINVPLLLAEPTISGDFHYLCDPNPPTLNYVFQTLSH